MQIFYAKDFLETKKLNEAESKHCLKVLRKKIGDKIFVTNGLGALSECEITDTSGKICSVSILNTENYTATTPPLEIAIAPTKNMDRLEFFVEKACEMGIQTITPILCFHSERKQIKLERLEKIIVSACKQSKNFNFPVINPLTKLSDIVACEKEQKLIAHCNSEKKIDIRTLDFNKDTIILIGPEGDFSDSEIKSALESNFQPISLGESRLRTETAGLLACAVANLNSSYF